MIAAVDIGGTKIGVGIVDAEGKLLCHSEFPTRAEGAYKDALESTVTMLRSQIEKAGVKLHGIGIGSTGPIDPFTGEIGDVNFFPHWRGQNPVQDLQKIFGVPVAMENDADAAGLGEAGWGVGRKKLNLIYVTVGTGIGVGVILNGEVYRGVDRSHPEIGHHVIDPSGPQCLCGFRGCWESLAAGPAMVSWIESNAPSDYPYRAQLTAKQICELAIAGESWALRAVQREGHYLGLGLANLVTIFAPEMIVLSGGVMRSSQLFLEQIRRTIVGSCRFVPYDRTELALASLGEHTNLIGAARVWHHRFGRAGENRAV